MTDNETSTRNRHPLPIVRKVRTLHDARFAVCRKCHTIITPSLYWGLNKVIHLHHTGSCDGKTALFGWDD